MFTLISCPRVREMNGRSFIRQCHKKMHDSPVVSVFVRFRTIILFNPVGKYQTQIQCQTEVTYFALMVSIV
jgi:hypothetical protein